MDAFYPYIVAIGGILFMMAIWLLVQMAWGRVFPGVSCDVDVLAGRPKCCGCAEESDCELRGAIQHGRAVEQIAYAMGGKDHSANRRM